MNIAQPQCRRETSRCPAQVEEALLLPSAEWILRMAARTNPQESSISKKGINRMSMQARKTAISLARLNKFYENYLTPLERAT